MNIFPSVYVYSQYIDQNLLKAGLYGFLHAHGKHILTQVHAHIYNKTVSF